MASNEKILAVSLKLLSVSLPGDTVKRICEALTCSVPSSNIFLSFILIIWYPKFVNIGPIKSPFLASKAALSNSEIIIPLLNHPSSPPFGAPSPILLLGSSVYIFAIVPKLSP